MLLELAGTGLFALAIVQPEPPRDTALREPAVTLLEPGAEPRQTIRYRPLAGSTEPMVMTMTMDVAMTADGQPLPDGRTPPMQMTMAIDIQEVQEDGDIRYRMRLDEAKVLEAEGVPAELAGRLDTALRSMVGLSGDVLISDRGVTKEARFVLPENAGPQLEQMLAGMRQSLSQFSAPVPEEPVGPGARWTVQLHPVANGMQLDQTVTYTLESIDDAGADMNIEYTQTAQPQRVNPLGLPPDAAIDLKSLAGSGAGRIRIVYDRLVPAESTLRGSTTSNMAISAARVTQQIQQKITLHILVGPEPPAPAQE